MQCTIVSVLTNITSSLQIVYCSCQGRSALWDVIVITHHAVCRIKLCMVSSPAKITIILVLQLTGWQECSSVFSPFVSHITMQQPMFRKGRYHQCHMQEWGYKLIWQGNILTQVYLMCHLPHVEVVTHNKLKARLEYTFRSHSAMIQIVAIVKRLEWIWNAAACHTFCAKY